MSRERRAARKAKRVRWAKARVAESGYATQLKAVARHVGLIVRTMAPDGNPSAAVQIGEALSAYANALDPWARAVARLVSADVSRRDEAMWFKQSALLGKELSKELRQAPTGSAFYGFQAEQVRLIKSIPLEAAQRVHELATSAITDSARAADVAKKILATEDVSRGRAMLIARTEVARASSNLVQARSRYAGSDGYIWRTSEDGDVRPSHDKMEGVYVRWDSPPTLDKMVGHAGTLPNCRCFAEPVFPND